MPNPFTFKPRQKPYTVESLTELKNDANKLFTEKKYKDAIEAYKNVYEKYPHNEEDEIIVLHMTCKSNVVACLLALWKDKKAHQDGSLAEYTPEFALGLCNEILKCDEARDLHIKALYRKILVLQHMNHIEDAMKDCAEAMRRFPNAAFFRQLFDQMTNEETERRQKKLSEAQHKKLQQVARLTMFHEGDKVHAMHLNDKRWGTQELNRMAQALAKCIHTHDKECKSVSVFHFNAHDVTAHISYVGTELKDEREILDHACRAFFDLDTRSTRQTMVYDAEEHIVEAYDRSASRIDSTELEQYQQLAMVMRDRYGRGVTVSVMKE